MKNVKSEPAPMGGNPTIFQLAQLAALRNRQPGQEREAVQQAMALWREAALELAEPNPRAVALAGILAAIYEDEPKNWRARLKDYPGTPRELSATLSVKMFPTIEVQTMLWKDKTLSRATRDAFWRGLPQASIFYEVEVPRHRPWPQEILEAPGKKMTPEHENKVVDVMVSELAKPQVCAHVVRWAVEVR